MINCVDEDVADQAEQMSDWTKRARVKLDRWWNASARW